MSEDADEDLVEIVPPEEAKAGGIPYMEDPVGQRVIACSFLIKTIGADHPKVIEEAVNLLGAVIRSIAAPETKVRQVK